MSGHMQVIVNGNSVNTIEPGDGFGELALLHDSLRTATIVATADCYLWCVDRKTFRIAVESVNAITYSENESFVASVPLLNALTTS
jgi:CRP-like cAMP-binding protein